MLYKKVCPVDSKIFYSQKINTIYCSKRCANRVRYLPSKLVERLVASVSKYTLDEREYHKMTLDNDALPERDSSILPQELDDLETLARVKKREIEEQEEYAKRQSSLLSKSGFGSVISEDAEETTENDLSLSNINNVIDHIRKPQQTARTYKIKKFGG